MSNKITSLKPIKKIRIVDKYQADKNPEIDETVLKEVKILS